MKIHMFKAAEMGTQSIDVLILIGSLVDRNSG